MTRSHSSFQPSNFASAKIGSAGRIVHLIAIGLACAVAVILAALWLWRGGFPGGPDIAYTQFGPIRTTNLGYAMSATVSLETNASDARWARENSAPLQQALQQALSGTDARMLHNPDGLQDLQERLEQAVNEAVPGSHVQHVFITDLVYQSEDE